MKIVKRQTVKVEPPFNMTADEKHLYTGGEFDLFPEDVMEFRNVKLTSLGYCFKNGKLIPGSTHVYPTKFPAFEKEGLREMTWQSPVRLDPSKQYLLIHHPWDVNYYHWLTEALPRIWAVKDQLKSMVLLLPQIYQDLPFIMRCLEAFHPLTIEYVPFGHTAEVPRAIIPRHKPFSYTYNPETVKHVAALLREKIGSRYKGVTYDYLYVMRGDSDRRRIANEAEVFETLDSYNVKSFDFPELDLIDQVGLAMNSKLLISNGSGLANMMFMLRGCVTLELRKRITNHDDFLDRVLWYFATACDLKYAQQVCEPVKKQADMYIVDLLVDIPTLKMNIERCIAAIDKE